MIEFRQLVHKIGLDKSIAYSSGARIVQGGTGIASVFFITSFLTGVEQGFYYTFGSILALQVFFELGLTGIMTQYVAHEVSHLTFNPETLCYEGEERYRSRLASLVHFCVKWYLVLSIVVMVVLNVVGFVYFSKYGDSAHSNVEWRIPWILLSVASAFRLFVSPFTNIFMGLGYVKEMSKLSFYMQFLQPVATWICLACGLKLYVIGVGYLLSTLWWFVFVYRERLMPILLHLWEENITDRVSYMKELFPYQWRIALSWVSGYFIFQLFNPVLFATEGAIVAGQMGMTLQAINAIQSFSMNWINTKIPLYSKLIALKDYVQLDKIFNKTLLQMTNVCFVLIIVFFLALWMLDVTQLRIGKNVLSDRFLSYLPTLIMVIPMYLQQYVYSWATYLRCHKREPFLVNSIVSGILCCTSALVLGQTFGLYGLTLGYCCISICMMPWGYWIYKTNKQKWHER